MIWQTHAVSGVFLASVGFRLAGLPLSPEILGIAALGALMPDLDASESKTQHLRIRWGRGKYRQEIKPFFALAEVLHSLFGHRGVLHSFLTVFVLAVAALFLFYAYAVPPILSLAFLVGYVSHLFTDSMTISGTPFFYPYKKMIRFLPKRFFALKEPDQRVSV
jgi:inner membrane protein